MTDNLQLISRRNYGPDYYDQFEEGKKTYYEDPSRFLVEHPGEFVMTDAEAQRIFHVLFAPGQSSRAGGIGQTTALQSVVKLKNFLILNVMDDVKTRVEVFRVGSQRRKRAVAPAASSSSSSSVSVLRSALRPASSLASQFRKVEIHPWSASDWDSPMDLDVLTLRELDSHCSTNRLLVEREGFLTPTQQVLFDLDAVPWTLSVAEDRKFLSLT